MKKLFSILLVVLPVLVKAQADTVWYGTFEEDCNRYVLQRLVARDTMLGNMPHELLGPKVKTLLVQKTSLSYKLPNNVGAYTIHYIDPANISKADYRMLKDSTASIFYLSNPQARYAYYDVYVMPLYAVKKGGHINAEYTGKGCKCAFYMDYSKSRFGYDRTSCF